MVLNYLDFHFIIDTLKNLNVVYLQNLVVPCYFSVSDYFLMLKLGKIIFNKNNNLTYKKLCF